MWSEPAESCGRIDSAQAFRAAARDRARRCRRCSSVGLPLTDRSTSWIAPNRSGALKATAEPILAWTSKNLRRVWVRQAALISALPGLAPSEGLLKPA